MNKISIKDLGNVVYWTDYVQVTKDEEGELVFNQSNTPLEGFHPRMVGLTFKDKKWYVAVALSPGGDTLPRTGRGVINSRIREVIKNDDNITPTMRGVTMVPESYFDYLYKDKYATNNIYGMLDPTILNIMVKNLMKL